MAPPDLRLSIQQLSIELERAQALNLTSGRLHSTSAVIYYLSIALLMVSHHKMEGNKDKPGRSILNAIMVPFNSYRLNAQSK
jgi:hypothetical protein